MHIVQFQHTRVPVEKYGGAQRIVVWLSQALVEMCHDVTLLAGRGSKVPGVRVFEIDAETVRAPGFDPRRYVSHPVDIMHYHSTVLNPPLVPYVETLHGNMGPGRAASPHTICVSENHARRHGTSAYVLNGVRLDEYEFRSRKADFDLFLARLHSVKGWRIAVAAAKSVPFKLIVAGGWRPSFSRWVTFVGEVGGARKRELLAGGTPVLATPRGSLRELVGADGGGIGAGVAELLALRSRVEQFDPHTCRRRAERCFTHLRMARDYMRMYEGMLANGRLPAGRRPDAA